MVEVLHIVPHFGGGVGVVLTALLDVFAEQLSYNQSVVCFEYLNQFGREWRENCKIPVFSEVLPDGSWLHDRVEAADLVHIHFWNHPLLNLFLYSFSGRKARMVFWAHVNGRYSPYLFNETVLNYPDIFVVSSAYSLSSSAFSGKSRAWKQEHLRLIPSSSGTKGLELLIPQEHDRFQVGYIGTVDYCKMHRSFIDICAQIPITGLNVIVCGGPNENLLEKEAEAKGVKGLFDFRGHVDSVQDVLRELDLFIYPLSKENYGTGEQVLIEALSAGVPQVVFADSPEAYVINPGKTGLAANNIKEYVESVVLLYNNVNLRMIFSKNSRSYAMEHYSLDKTFAAWERLYKELLLRKKRVTEFSELSEKDFPFALFLNALGDCPEAELYRELYACLGKVLPRSLRRRIAGLAPIHIGATRGSVRHYSSFFQNEKTCLHSLAEIIALTTESES